MISPINQAISLHQNGDLLNAQKLYELCIKNDPKNIDFLMLYAMLAAQLNKPEIVISAMKRVLKIDPTNERALFNLGMAHRNQGQFDFAIKNFESAILLFDMHHQHLCNALMGDSYLLCTILNRHAPIAS